MALHEPNPQPAPVIQEYGLPDTIQGYQPEIWQVKKDTIYGAIHCLVDAIDFTSLMLQSHDSLHGRSNRRDRLIAEDMETSLAKMKQTLADLRSCKEN